MVDWRLCIIQGEVGQNRVEFCSLRGSLKGLETALHELIHKMLKIYFKVNIVSTFTKISCRRKSDAVLVTDGDSGKPDLFSVFHAQVDVDGTRQEVANAVLNLERGERRSDHQQHDPDGPSAMLLISMQSHLYS